MDEEPDPFAAFDGDASAGAPGADSGLQSIFAEANATVDKNLDAFLSEVHGRELDTGNKADDAIDFADISDDDLPDEEGLEDEVELPQLSGSTVQDAQGGEVDDFDLDELFGGSSPVQERSEEHGFAVNTQEDSQLPSPESLPNTHPPFRPVNYGTGEDSATEVNAEELEMMHEQARLFEQSRRGGDPTLFPPPETTGEYFDRVWPNFEDGKPLRFFSLLPRKRLHYSNKEPLRGPKIVHPTKANVDLAPDAEKVFRLASSTTANKGGRQWEEEHNRIISIPQKVETDSDSDDEIEMDDTMEDTMKIGRVSWNDVKVACVDWDIPDLESPSEGDQSWSTPSSLASDSDLVQDLLQHPPKKQKLSGGLAAPSFSVYGHPTYQSWDDPEIATARVSRKCTLNMNDPEILLDIQPASTEEKKPRTMGLALKRDSKGSLANPMFKRYNISNDEAYDALKESSLQKVRSTLGHMNIEHSLPALKLQYPFYKVNLGDRELRSFHRPTVEFREFERVRIKENKIVKRKHKRNLKPAEAFSHAEDLGVGDNSDLLLAEYCEEYPTTLSNFGMGNKIVNYYRRKDNEDNSRPKHELGETAILLPQDKSPFSLFGIVEPGQTVPTLHNAMYRAPIFQHNPKPTDFLVSRSRTGQHGSKYYMRNLQNLVVVGQEFPSVEVPGTHARKVTEASKKRLKMLSYRLYRKGEQKGARQPWVSNEMIKYHLPGTEVAQNRSRMREIMKYDKDKGTWHPLPGETIPDEATLRTWIKPEDVCLIDSMHAGNKHLEDAGFKASDIKEADKEAENDNADAEDEEDNNKLELKLAPWVTTKNFLNACQQKAMLALHGEGDPTGRGEGFSFIKTSMKGGFRDIGESVGDRLDAKNKKELGGHSYNVQQQQQRYEAAIQRIWKKQAESLSSRLEHSDVEMDDVDGVDPTQQGIRGRFEYGTSGLMRNDDDTMSQFSRNSNTDTNGKKMKLRRMLPNKKGELEAHLVTVTDPEVIKLYTKRKKEEKLMNLTIDDLRPTGNADFDREQREKLLGELARLRRNVERREGREKAKGIDNKDTSVAGTPAPGKSTGATPRKCANCGEVGHIKTNKKLCPLLNGSRKQSDTFKDAGAASPVTAATNGAMSPP
ncbi:hypothetical protein P154DRAFT_522087 [Amniculicola lignicola CBS 123094]|uniref:Transcription initiation factor TFIID subunit 1 histone acetyltransferase domain-containing protein n=1 Tax=Amniculicola lignicola CBS 123094 TaxID=1392246 RepID=A0A6A5WJJ6_9PLEO|nr:hypothetical protein P154DRAFT_522087 [Amniculicola lignicola CBS 123094]